MVWHKPTAVLMLTACLALQTFASGLNNVGQGQADLLKPRNIDAGENEQPQRYYSSDEKMPAECNATCDKFWSLSADCRVKTGTDWQACVCTTENFDAWNVCASCAPEYYDLYEGGLPSFFKNALSECEAVGRPVNLTTKLPEGKAGTFTAAKNNGTTSNVRMGGSSKSGATTSTSLVNAFMILALSGSLASLFLF